MVSRRDFLRVGGIGVVGLSVAEKSALARMRAAADTKSCIFILMTGGPSQFETFDPKPEAPLDVRGPLRAINTSVPGILLSESLPRLAKRADRFAILRSLTHDAAPIHETGQQLLQTGRLNRRGLHFPSYGAVVSKTLGVRESAPPYVVLPQLLRETGVNTSRGQQAGFLGGDFEPTTGLDSLLGAAAGEEDVLGSLGFDAEPESVQDAYGDHRFGRLCVQARQLVERGTRCVTVNLFDSLTGQITWDCHGRDTANPSTVNDYADSLCPAFDRALSALLDDLDQRGMLEDTLVVAAGEFGRTPKINRQAGRDHWPACWSALMAGGGVQGGRTIGASDALGREVTDRPISPGELTATIYHRLGLDPAQPLLTSDGSEISLCDHQSIAEVC